MSVRGLWQLRRLVVSYCDWGGSSRGARDFVASVLPGWAAENPQLEVVQLLRRGQHPFLQGEFANGRQKVVGVKNEGPQQILGQARRLRNSTGRKVIKLRSRHVYDGIPLRVLGPRFVAGMAPWGRSILLEGGELAIHASRSVLT